MRAKLPPVISPWAPVRRRGIAAQGLGLAALLVPLLLTAEASAQPRTFEGERAVTSDAATSEPEPIAIAAAPADPAAATPPTSTAPAAESAPASKPNPAPASRRAPYPRLVIAGGPVIGPHAYGNEECRAEEQRCEVRGTFFGFGLNVELRVRLWRPLYAHARAILVANASPRDPVHSGLYGGGLGFGAYARRAFARAEYLLVGTLGDDHFGRPFGNGDVARDRWSHHAGLFSVGARMPFKRRSAAELWGGLMVGPRSARAIPDEPVDRRTLLTFLVGVNFAYDLLPARKH